MRTTTILTITAFAVADATNLDLFDDPRNIVLKGDRGIQDVGLTAIVSPSSPSSQSMAASSAGGLKPDMSKSSNDKDNSDDSEPAFQTTARLCEPVDVDALLHGGYLKSQDGEDQCLFTFFNGLCGGKYMEMGALDGVRFSNSYAFYASPTLNWRGVNVELIPDNYEKLIVNRPLDLANVHAAVCDKTETLHYVHTKSNAVGGIWEFASAAHREKWFGDVKLEDATPIQCSPLQDILDQAVGTDKFFFDFYSLDIEGAEISALHGINFEQTGFGVLVIERHANKEDNDEVASFLASKGYDIMPKAFHTEGCGGSRNLWYINRDFDKIYGQVFPQEKSYLRG